MTNAHVYVHGNQGSPIRTIRRFDAHTDIASRIQDATNDSMFYDVDV